ncbi:MAG: TIGR00282 family metallophosphoesterase [Candidatus Gracilibacteria bacterium]|nr:TIGR00282 family metallophosphoesterase [Candidatus Gracilibacteria bacterium]
MKLLIFGDIFGRNGRRLVAKYISSLKDKYSPDFIIGNSENITSGKGPVLKHIIEMKELGFDCLTGGDHTFSNLRDIREYLEDKDSIQLRPFNYYESRLYKVPGKGFRIIEKDGKKLLVINLIGSAFIGGQSHNPFIKVDELLESFKDEKFDGIIVDFHRETTAEIYAMSEFLSSRVSVVYGTHTHVQTNDEHILGTGTAMITDIGMVGSLHSSIGQTFDTRLPQFISGLNIFGERPEQDMGLGCVNGIYVEIEDFKCIKIEKIRIIEENK